MPTKVGKVRLALDLRKQYGTLNFSYRVLHLAVRRAGLLRRLFPANGWDAQPLTHWCRPDVPIEPAAYKAFRERSSRRFFFPAGDLPNIPSEWTADAVAKADDILRGRFQFFSAIAYDLGFPFDWLLNPMNGRRVDATRHWCDRNEFEADQGDIKFIWEASRFAWVYTLVRAYAHTRDERYAEGFWTLVDSWRQANPPNMGPNWQCGQECAFRAMAICFGLYGFWRSPATTPERVAWLAALLAVHAQRIQTNIRFAQVQMGNHALSEAVGLYTIGTLFPEFKKADNWRQHGRHIIDLEARMHSYRDGSYIQHSLNYHRLMLDDYRWSLRLAELNEQEFEPLTREIVDLHGQYVYQLQNEENGRVPNYGQNDGSLIMPVNGCPYLDYRPVAEGVHYQLHRRRLYPRGPWEEDLYWLFGEAAAHAPRDDPARVSRRYDIGGYYTLRGQHTWGMIRIHTIIHHPHQADMLHLDVWWRGLNVLHDVGSYSYNAPEPWRHYFVSTSSHNSVEIGGESQMIRPQRFSWTYLTRSSLHEYQPGLGPNIDYVQGEHYGYQRLASQAVHRRAVLRLGEQYWLVVDDVFGQGREQVKLCWQLIDAPYEASGRRVVLDTPQGPVGMEVLAAPEARFEVVRGEVGPPARGWQSIHYGERLPAPSLSVSTDGALPQRFVTLLSLGCVARLEQQGIDERGANRLIISGVDILGTEAAEPREVNLEPCEVTLAPLAPGSGRVVERFSLGRGTAQPAPSLGR